LKKNKLWIIGENEIEKLGVGKIIFLEGKCDFFPHQIAMRYTSVLTFDNCKGPQSQLRIVGWTHKFS
jgi:hypothetical protein